MMRLFYWIGVFLLGAVVAHLVFVLIMPKYEARALVGRLHQQLGVNAFTPLQGPLLRRLVRHPLPDATYGACVLDISTQQATILRGPALRAPWALTVHSPRGDVIYAITDRHVPAGTIDIRFEHRPPAENGIIALPRMQQRQLVVPLTVPRAVMVLEVFPWHPGQVRLVRDLVSELQCRSVPLASDAGAAGAAANRAGNATTATDAQPRQPMPRARPQRAPAP